MPTGRTFIYSPTKNYRGEPKWPETTIKNYPVQGTGADIMAIIRVDFCRRFRKAGIRGVVVATVHDSIVVDIHPDEFDKVVKIFYSVFEDMPKNFKKIFGIEYNLPIFCEISYGTNMKELTEI